MNHRNVVPPPSRRHWCGSALSGLALLLAPLDGWSAEPDAPPTFRVMSYNIHHGEGADGRIDLARIAAVIRAERADVVALQEVDKGVERTARRDFPAELSALTGMACVFSNNFHYQGGEYGNALLARFPVLGWTNTHLKMLRAGEQRGMLQATLEVQGRRLLVVNTHLDYRKDDAERVQSVGEIRALLERSPPGPVLVCGDFNDPPDSRTYRAMAEVCDDVWLRAGTGPGLTITSTRPYRRIDYLWVRKGSALTPIRAWVPPTEASDHLPLVAEFRLD